MSLLYGINPLWNHPKARKDIYLGVKDRLAGVNMLKLLFIVMM